MKEEFELFLQGEGVRQTELIRISADATVADLLAEAQKRGVPNDGSGHVFVEDAEQPCRPDQHLREAGIKHQHPVHCHRCRQVSVTVNYQQNQFTEGFPPSTTMAKLKKWVEKELTHERAKTRKSPAEVAELALQLCGTTTRPGPDEHLGALTAYPACTLCFDLVPKDRVQGAW